MVVVGCFGSEVEVVVRLQVILRYLGVAMKVVQLIWRREVLVESQWFVLGSLGNCHSLVMELNLVCLGVLALVPLILAPELGVGSPQGCPLLLRPGSFDFPQSLPFLRLPCPLLAQHFAVVAIQLVPAGSPLLWVASGFSFDLRSMSSWTLRWNC